MAILKCKMCGGDLDIQEGASVAQCEFCGSKQTVPKVDDEKKLNLFERANKLRSNCEFDKAYGIYESIVAEFKDEAEAYWGLVLCEYGIEYVDDPKTGNKIPTCHRSSFESVMENPNLDLALENSDVVARTLYREEAKAIEEIRKGIIEISSKEEPYDIFICYKETDLKGERTVDSLIAEDIYNALTEKEYKVFFARITLEDKLGQEYEPYIFRALHSARVMLVVGTDYEYFNAVWVKNEWSRYLKMMAKGEKKTLIPCYKGIDAYDIPKEFARLQAQDMGKVGAIQDLVRGISKIIPKKKPEAPVQQTANNNQPTASTEALIKRAYAFLQAKETKKASEYFDKILDVEPDNREALTGTLLLELGLASIKELEESCVFFNSTKSYASIKSLCSDLSYYENILEKIKENNINAMESAFARKDFSGISKHANLLINYEEGFEKAYEYKLLADFEVTSLDEIANKLTPINKAPSYAGYYQHTSDENKKKLGEIFGAQVENIEALTDSAFEKGDFEAVTKYANVYLEFNSKVEAPYLYLFFADMKIKSFEELAKLEKPFNQNRAYIELTKYWSKETKEEFVKAEAEIRGRIKAEEEKRKALEAERKALEDKRKAEEKAKKKKKTIIIIACIIAALIIVGVVLVVFFTSDTYIYGAKDDGSGGIVLTDYLGSDGDITIPDKIGGKPVTTIGNAAFCNYDSITSVVIPNSVTTIGERAFQYCRSLTSVVIPNSVTTIGEEAFEFCSSLTSVVIPNSVTTIGDYAFCDCTSLTSIVIPDSVTTIGECAFSDCDSLTSIVIPNSVTTIGCGAFYNCYSLTIYCEIEELEKPEGWHYDWNLSDRPVVWGCTGAFGETEDGFKWVENKSGINIFGYTGNATTLEIPSEINGKPVTTIGESAFSYCDSLTSIVIPNSVTTIGNGAFYLCSSLTIYCEAESKPEGWDSSWNNTGRPVVWNISGFTEDGLAYGETENGITISGYTGNATTLEIPSEINGKPVTAIGYIAFSDCDSLKSVVIPNSVTTIGCAAFEDCDSLESVVIPSSVTIIFNMAFVYCDSLTIYCEAETKPEGWEYDWNCLTAYSYCPVVWGYTGE